MALHPIKWIFLKTKKPITCFELGTIAMFIVSEAGFPQYDPDSLFNINDFDAGPFDALQNQVEANPRPFYYRFNQPGVFSFKLVNSDEAELDRDLYVQVGVKQIGGLLTNKKLSAKPWIRLLKLRAPALILVHSSHHLRPHLLKSVLPCHGRF